MLRQTEKKARLLVQDDQSFEDVLEARSIQRSEGVVDTEISLSGQGLSWRDGSSIGEQAKYAQLVDDPSPSHELEILLGEEIPDLFLYGSLIRAEGEISNTNTPQARTNNEPDVVSEGRVVDSVDGPRVEPARRRGSQGAPSKNIVNISSYKGVAEML